jgi:hypothetical protein
MTSKIIISPRTKTTWHKNKISGVEWSTQVPLKGFEVSGGEFFTTTHTSIKGAEKEAKHRKDINEKFPFTMPRSKREINKMKKLGLTYF